MYLTRNQINFHRMYTYLMTYDDSRTCIHNEDKRKHNQTEECDYGIDGFKFPKGYKCASKFLRAIFESKASKVEGKAAKYFENLMKYDDCLGGKQLEREPEIISLNEPLEKNSFSYRDDSNFKVIIKEQKNSSKVGVKIRPLPFSRKRNIGKFW